MGQAKQRGTKEERIKATPKKITIQELLVKKSISLDELYKIVDFFNENLKSDGSYRVLRA